jgi:microcystin-dependent protein
MNPFLGMIRAFAFPQVPKGWAACNGQLLPINQYQALYSLLGTAYGGDGRTTFALPDLRGRAIVGTGPNVQPGKAWGSASTTLNPSQLPLHTHQISASSAQASGGDPTGNGYAKTVDNSGQADLKCYGPAPTQGQQPVAMLPTLAAGGNQPLNVQNPFLGINYCIATQGIFPSRS